MRDSPVSRRGFLGRLVGGGLLGGVAGVAVPGGTGSPLETVGDAPDTEAATDPVPEAETPYAVFQHEPTADGSDFVPTAPINVVCPLEDATFSDVIDVFRAAGWTHRPAEYARYAYDRNSESWHRSHWSGAQSVVGVGSRLHVRCWELAGTASIQAHIDSDATPRHRIVSYADGAQAVVDLAARAGWPVDTESPETIDFRNARPPDHDGEALVIRR